MQTQCVTGHIEFVFRAPNPSLQYTSMTLGLNPSILNSRWPRLLVLDSP
jgi:hypothetical protein